MDGGRLLPSAPQFVVFDLLDPVDDVGDPLVDALPHQVEGPHAFSLVFHLRIDLGVAAKAHARPQVVHRQEVVLPGVVEDLQEHRPLHPLHLVAGIVGLGVSPPRRRREHRLQFVEIRRRKIGCREGRVEPLLRPGQQALAVEAAAAVGQPTGEVR